MEQGNTDILTKRIRGLRIIALALTIGLTVSSAVIVVIFHTSLGGKAIMTELVPGVPVISIAVMVMIVGGSLMGNFLSTTMANGGVRMIGLGTWTPPPQSSPQEFEGDAAKLGIVYSGSMVVRFSLIEGPGLLGSIAYLFEGHWLALAAIGASIALMAFHIPNRDTVQTWIEDKLRVVEETRRARG